MKDPIDTTIDQVATRMVQVSEDANLTERIVAALPERTSRFSWLIPQFAVITAFAIAAVVWTTRETPAPTLLPSSDVAGLAGMPNTVAAMAPGTVAPGTFAPGTAFRTPPLEPLEPVEPLERLDHERSLPALTVSDLSPGELPATPALMLAPIEIADLPMTAESFSPR